MGFAGALVFFDNDAAGEDFEDFHCGDNALIVADEAENAFGDVEVFQLESGGVDGEVDHDTKVVAFFGVNAGFVKIAAAFLGFLDA